MRIRHGKQHQASMLLQNDRHMRSLGVVGISIKMRNPPRRLLLLVALSTTSLMIVVIAIRFNAFGLMNDTNEMLDFYEPSQTLTRTDARQLAVELANLRKEMVHESKANSKILFKLDGLIQKLDPSQQALTSSTSSELCAESYLGAQSIEWKRAKDCEDSAKFNEMVSVVLIYPSSQLLLDVVTAYPGIPIVVASNTPPVLQLPKGGMSSMGVSKAGESYRGGPLTSFMDDAPLKKVHKRDTHPDNNKAIESKTTKGMITKNATTVTTNGTIELNFSKGNTKQGPFATRNPSLDTDDITDMSNVGVAKQAMPTEGVPEQVAPTEGGTSDPTTPYDTPVNIAWVRLPSQAPPPGHAWNLAIRQVRTPYALLGRGLRRFPAPSVAADLRRALTALMSIPGVGVVGGSVRNATGHWRAACYEMSLRNYALTLHPGYRHSAHECMFCDYVDGPIVARVTALTAIDPNLIDEKSVFLDLFLRLLEHQLVIACPDVQFEGRHHITVLGNSWLPLARKWMLNSLHIADSLWKFSCSEIGMSCNEARKRTDRFLLPPCCRQLLEDQLAKWAKFCDKHGLQYRLDSGSVLGAVKMQGLIPWDLDGDALYLTANHTFFATEGAKLLADLNVTVDSFKAPPVRKPGETGWLPAGYFVLSIDGLYVEMWGVPSFNDDQWDPRPKDTLPTRVLHGRDWLVTPYNPGRYSRNRYGPEMLRHAQSWLQTGKTSSWEPYSPGRFKSCRNSHHHACLDRYPADGNLPFGPQNFA